MRALLCGLALVAAGCGRPAATAEPAEASHVDFADNAAKYKGKTLRLTLTIGVDVRGTDSLRNHAGKPVPFAAVGPNGERLNVTIKMPAAGDLPNAKFPDKVVVTFVCNEGQLAAGNEATKVVRP